jgi:hypothetical protein
MSDRFFVSDRGRDQSGDHYRQSVRSKEAVADRIARRLDMLNGQRF